jgi:hypothetical protein
LASDVAPFSRHDTPHPWIDYILFSLHLHQPPL